MRVSTGRRRERQQWAQSCSPSAPANTTSSASIACQSSSYNYPLSCRSLSLAPTTIAPDNATAPHCCENTQATTTRLHVVSSWKHSSTTTITPAPLPKGVFLTVGAETIAAMKADRTVSGDHCFCLDVLDGRFFYNRDIAGHCGFLCVRGVLGVFLERLLWETSDLRWGKKVSRSLRVWPCWAWSATRSHSARRAWNFSVRRSRTGDEGDGIKYFLVKIGPPHYTDHPLNVDTPLGNGVVSQTIAHRAGLGTMERSFDNMRREV